MKNNVANQADTLAYGRLPLRVIILNHDITATAAGLRLIKTASVSVLPRAPALKLTRQFTVHVYFAFAFAFPSLHIPHYATCVRARAYTPVSRSCVCVRVFTRTRQPWRSRRTRDIGPTWRGRVSKGDGSLKEPRERETENLAYERIN